MSSSSSHHLSSLPPPSLSPSSHFPLLLLSSFLPPSLLGKDGSAQRHLSSSASFLPSFYIGLHNIEIIEASAGELVVEKHCLFHAYGAGGRDGQAADNECSPPHRWHMNIE